MHDNRVQRENNIKMDLSERGCEVGRRMDLAQERY
jgi:hypothetical protein